LNPRIPWLRSAALEDVFIGLGSNIGDRFKNLTLAACSVLRIPEVEFVKASSLYETEPVGMEGQPWFLNAVLWIRSAIPPMELLSKLLEIERGMGRVRKEPWGPRVIDLDILIFGAMVVKGEFLEVPHPRMHERRFVLEPLAEIAPNLTHPVMGVTIADLLQRVDHSKKVFKVAPWEATPCFGD
jgi:2-amino-4-hydroxy-6-hydroxymethyldihydropteridine diphosphokinase